MKLTNFKSFGDYKENEVIVEPRITAIVGKNESGKSNVLDGLSQIRFRIRNNAAFNQDNIKTQIITDLGVYEKDSGEYEYIKEFYNKWKTLFNFRIEDLEV